MGNPEKEKSEKNDVFDVRRIRRLVELMQDNDLAEIDLRQGEMRIQMRRNSPNSLPAASVYHPFPTQGSAPFPVAVAPPVPSGGPATTQTAVPATEVDESHVVYVKSPMVGTFYAARDPESPPYAKVGDTVSPETTVCILEAMKVFNEIQAEVAGKIVAVLVSNGDPVEFGKPLFKIDTRG